MRNATHIGSNKRNRRHTSHAHGRHHPPAPITPPPHPPTEQKDKCKSKPACAESRESAKILQKPMRNATHTGKHRKKRCEMQRSTRFCTVQPGGWDTFAIQHRKNRCESRSKVKFWVRNVPKLEFQHMPAKESHHPARRQTQRLPTTTTTTTTTTTAEKTNNTSD